MGGATNLKISLLMTVLVVAVVGGNTAAKTIYVDADANGLNNGSIWADAYNYILDAVAAADPYDEIWVAEGYYDGTIELVSNVAIYGGFAGTESMRDQRDWQIHRTVLWGGDYRAIESMWAESAVVDGFIITYGYAVGYMYPDYAGGGMANFGGNSTVINCTFTDNWARVGGGVANFDGNLTVINCTFDRNLAFDDGGGIYNQGFFDSSSLTVINCTFRGNQADWDEDFRGNGGGISSIGEEGVASANSRIVNCTFYDNWALAGCGVSTEYGDTTLTNCILWRNNDKHRLGDTSMQVHRKDGTAIVKYCCIQGGTGQLGGIGNFDVDTLLTPDGHLRSDSPCINTGDPNYAPDPNAPTDIDGDDRIIAGQVDIGSDEFLDSDGDRLPDWWEQRYFNDPNIANPDADPDGDGLTNLQEYEEYSSDPNAPPYYVDAIDGNDFYDGLAPTPQGGGVGPKKTISGGMRPAGGGDTVLVTEGTYTGWLNILLDYHNHESVIVVAPNGATIDCNNLGRALEFTYDNRDLFAVLQGFTIINGNADIGGGILAERSRFMFKDCVLSGNTATNKAGGICAVQSILTLNNLTIQGNTAPPNEPNAGLMTESVLNLSGDLNLDAGRLDVDSSLFYGPGQINLALGATLKVTTNPNNPTGPTVIRCNISGPGIIQVDLGSELIIEGDAIINLAHETDPNLNGTILCNGLLLVRDSVHLSNANIQVTRASFEGDVDISNSIITAEAGAPYGQFFVEDTVHITGNDIHADGDRYMDLDPAVFAGLIANNRIFITITEGVGKTHGGLLELRGKDSLVSGSSCDPNNEFFCEVNDVPAFDTNSWMIEELKVDMGAKVNLTNRFDFGNGGLYEVMYVKNLILEPNSLLNTAFNQLYYQNLVGDSNSVRNEPLLGFSLSNIALDNNNEFLTRVMHNNYTHPENPAYDRTHVKRIDGNEPDPNGMMQMCNFEDKDPQSPTYRDLFIARAKGLFAKASEDEILIRFEYLFGSSGPNVELVIYLSDVPELLDHNDPCRLDHYIEAARLYPPPAGQYGSAGSDHFGVFEKVVSAGDLDFIRGVRMELELLGPDGTCILINNWDPYVKCTYCGDVTGDFGVTPRDYLTVLGESGELSSGLSGLGLPLYCLDFGFSEDGFLDTTDLLGLDWESWLVSEGMVGHLCFDLCLTPCDGNTPPLPPPVNSAFIFEEMSTPGPEVGGAAGFTGSLLISGKRFDAGQQDFLSDRLYEFDESYNLVGGPYALPNDRVNGKLVRDHNDLLYQINVEEGLVRFSDLGSVIPRGQGVSIGSEPRYAQSAAVYVGFQDQGVDTWGRPFFDAAFDYQGNVYVTPVVVVPDVCDAYVASAKLALAPGQTPPYSIVEIYDVPPLPKSSQDDCNNLCEIEVDDSGNVYVVNRRYVNNSDILWVYDSNGAVRKCELQTLGIYGPVGLCCSSYDNSRLYLASSMVEPDATSASLYVLSTADLTLVQSVDINDMGHITDITEDPITGTLWVAGFTMPQYIDYLPSNLSQIPQFYHPYLAAVPYGSSGPVQATHLSDAADLALPLSIAWVVPTPDRCSGADLDGLGDVSLGDLKVLASQWLQAPGTPSADIAPVPGDGIVNFLDLAVLADHWLVTCGP